MFRAINMATHILIKLTKVFLLVGGTVAVISTCSNMPPDVSMTDEECLEMQEEPWISSRLHGVCVHNYPSNPYYYNKVGRKIYLKERELK